jgi:hypothetical protein
MNRIVVQADIADQIRRSEGHVELVDNQGQRLGIVHRPPSEEEIAQAKARVGSTGPKHTIDELIAKVESL